MLRARYTAVVLAFSWLGFARPAFAESAVVENEANRVVPTAPRVTVLLSPTVLYPFATLSVERRLVPWLGIAGIAGGGWSSAKPEGSDFHLVPTVEFGAQVRTHFAISARRAFASELGLGLQVLYGHVRGSEPAGQNPFMVPPGLSVAPLFSTGTMLRGGFTFGFDTGVAFLVQTEPLARDSWPARRVAFFERVNLGWSFE